ncbi:guanidinopropionase [Pseudomonas cuatrocienegasensis]|uniref:Guanidinopropionase n=1 Tax=Pseudomonas cuatrocienegasensis TaxID=543360 RepID=A0ABY1BEM9_9PSED|nr:MULTISPECIES: agmatinase [Pseudomonas]OEC34024.1 agmatinase [Pseudomonas sp. 21C1]SEQ67249.1 guanidinopropionase [Pseudomonas cuatrocienegasensis]
MPQDPKTQPRYTGIATFMRTPYSPTLAEVDIALVGIPFDGGVTNRPGARHGPREVRNQSSLMRIINQATGVAPFELCRVADVGDATPESPFELTAAHSAIQAFYEPLCAAGIVPLSVGGDHSVTLPVLRALAKDGPVALVHFDAHCDTGDFYLGSRFHHGSPFKVAAEEGLIDPLKTIQIGIRGGVTDRDIWKFSYDSGMRVISIEEFYQLGLSAVIEEIHRVVGDAPVYVTFDVDGLDPAYAPGTGTPEIGGFTPFEAQQMIRALGDLDIIGADVVEVSPPFDPSGNTALVGATLLFELLCVSALAWQRRQTSREA